MRLLLDTHLFIWLATDQSRLTAAELRLLTDEDSDVLLSAVSIWELRIKALAEARRGKAGVPLQAEAAVAWANGSDLRIVAPDADDYAAVLRPPLDHTDPFDEMLLAHAQRLDARLLTRDPKLAAHPIGLQL